MMLEQDPSAGVKRGAARLGHALEQGDSGGVNVAGIGTMGTSLWNGLFIFGLIVPARAKATRTKWASLSSDCRGLSLGLSTSPETS